MNKETAMMLATLALTVFVGTATMYANSRAWDSIDTAFCVAIWFALGIYWERWVL